MNSRRDNTFRHKTLQILGAAVAALCIGVPPVGKAAAQERTFDRKAWLQDYGVLKRALERSYSNLAWFASPQSGVDLPALDRRTLAVLHHAKTDEDARSALLAFVAGFHDGHFSQLATLAPATGSKIKDPAPFPYDREKPEPGCAALGYAANGRTDFSLSFESLPGFTLIADGQGQPFRAGILVTDGHVQIGIVRIYSFRTESYFAVCRKAWKGDVWDEHGQLRTSDLRNDIDKEWYGSLAEVLKQFEAAKVNVVLVDIGNNSGGNDSGDMAASLFSPIPMHSAKLRMSQDTAASKAYFDEEFAALKRAETYHPDAAGQHLIDEATNSLSVEQAKLASPCPMEWVWKKRQDWQNGGCKRLVDVGSAGGPLDYLKPGVVEDVRIAKRLHWPAEYVQLWGTWAGPTYVLTNNRTYSSAEMFAAVLQNNHAARIIGAQTGGDGCGFIDGPEPITLPNSQLRFRIPNCVRLRADGTDEVAGVKPDLPVLVTDESARVRAYRLTQEIETDLQAAH
jgi:C-terminal processing protease CtpA/Prc